MLAMRSEGCSCTDHRSPAIDQLNIEWKREGLPSSQFPTWLSTRNAQSQCSRVVCVYNTALYGSTRAVDTWREVRSTLDVISQVRGNLWGWVDGKAQLGFLPIVNGEPLEKEGSKT